MLGRRKVVVNDAGVLFGCCDVSVRGGSAVSIALRSYDRLSVGQQKALLPPLVR